MKFKKSNLDPVMIQLGEEKYPAKLTFRGYAELEEVFKMPFMEVFEKIGTNITIGELTDILYIMLKCGGVELEKDDLLDIEFGINIIEKISEVIERSTNVKSPVTSDIDTKKKI